MDMHVSSIPSSEGLRSVREPAYELLLPATPSGPLVLTSPHSGRDYPDRLLAATRLDPMTLRRSEDSFVELILSGAPRLGCPLLHALFPRVWCDVNREAWELDQAMFQDRLPDWVNARSPRVAAGLGTIARVVATGEPIYCRRLSFAEAEARIASCWKPFHQALAGLVEEARAACGFAVLLDCHSMPSVQGADFKGAAMPDFVLGDAHGTACHPWLTERAERLLSAMGYSVRRNDPYAGGYITRHYGAPRQGVHALQLEMNRALYMDEQRFQPLGTLARLSADIERLIADLVGTDWRAAGLAYRR